MAVCLHVITTYLITMYATKKNEAIGNQVNCMLNNSVDIIEDDMGNINHSLLEAVFTSGVLCCSQDKFTHRRGEWSVFIAAIS